MQEDKYKGMRGEFKGDFTRDTFDPINQFSRVLMQQGRVQLDADWNEQVSIMLHYLRNLACDLGSEHWGPGPADADINNTQDYAGFNIKMINDNNDFSIGNGHYYVKGLLCESGVTNTEQSDNLYTYLAQPDFPVFDELQKKWQDNLGSISTEQAILVYLDVWERHLTYVNDDSMREVALGGPDTTTRARLVWQIKVKIVEASVPSSPSPLNLIHPLKASYQLFLDQIETEKKPGTGELCAKVKDKTTDNNDPCLVAPESRYRGPENQLYRVEIHQASLTPEGLSQAPTYKWSKENASVIFPVTEINGEIISVEHLGRDCRYGLEANDWVEIIDDEQVLHCESRSLVQVVDVNREELTVTIKGALPSYSESEGDYQAKHVLLRRWDQKEGTTDGIPIVTGAVDNQWRDIEDGIQIQFKDSQNKQYQTGDYWLIPARIATGDIEWPISANKKPIALLPHGVAHHYAPLAIINKDASGGIVTNDLRRIIKQNWQ